MKIAAALMLTMPVAAVAQTANGSPTAPAPRGLVGTPRAVSRTAPSVGPDGVRRTPMNMQQPLPKETAQERADRLKLEHDLNICTGC